MHQDLLEKKSDPSTSLRRPDAQLTNVFARIQADLFQKWIPYTSKEKWVSRSEDERQSMAASSNKHGKTQASNPPCLNGKKIDVDDNNLTCHTTEGHCIQSTPLS
jgi:hypothetical protein